MKNLLKISLLMLFAFGLTACDDDKSYDDPGLEVSLYNLSGTWKLDSWNNGEALADGRCAPRRTPRRPSRDGERHACTSLLVFSRPTDRAHGTIFPAPDCAF